MEEISNSHRKQEKKQEHSVDLIDKAIVENEIEEKDGKRNLPKKFHVLTAMWK